jgi:4-methylaminobutanoate oxidase (formaldehyde-forming)
MQALTGADMSNEAFPYRHAREIEIGYARVLTVRISYVGELGYELYIPSEQALHVYDQIIEAGRAFDLRHVGLKALNSLRMEKGYRDYGHDMDNTDNAYEVGLGQFVKLSKEEDFIGKEACRALKREDDKTKRLVQVLVKDPEPFLFHAEIVLRDGQPLGYITSGAYAFTLGGAAGLAMLHADQPIDEAYVSAGTWEVNIAGRLYPAVVSLKPLYDPGSERVKG